MSAGARTLEGRGAIVTGGGRGIGAAIALALAGAGAAVVVSARTAAEIERTATAIRAAGGAAWPLVCDVAREADVEALVAGAAQHLPAIDILVNNAGVSSSAPLEKLSLADWDRTLAVSATGTFLMTRACVPGMKAQGRGRVINIASVAGLSGGRYIAHYAAAKHAVVGFTRSVALELAGTGVTINALCPGYADTPMTDRTLANIGARTGLSREQALAAVLTAGGQQRLVQPQDVADAVLALCAADAADTNGEAIVMGMEAPGA